MSVVPTKFVVGFVPALPVRFQPLLDQPSADIVISVRVEDKDIPGHAISDLALQTIFHGDDKVVMSGVHHPTLFNEYPVAVPPKKDPADLVLTSLVLGLMVSISHELSPAGVVCIITLPETSNAA